MTELSPAAQAVLDACSGVPFGDPCADRYGGPYIAAALRAAVKQVAPSPVLNPHSHVGALEEAVSNATGEVLVELLAIAAELEAFATEDR